MSMFVTVTLSDGTRVTEEVRNPDRVRWDMTAAKQKWPAFTDAAFLGTTFLAWAALKRVGKYNGVWEDFMNTDAVDIEMTDADGNPLKEEDIEKKESPDPIL